MARSARHGFSSLPDGGHQGKDQRVRRREQTRTAPFVADAVAATTAAATRGTPGRVYNIGGGSRVSVNEVLEMIGRVSGKRLQVVVDPVQKGDMRHTYADTSLARADLGYQPAVGLEQGLAEEFRWLSEALA
jgi:UDP-glucose 4-epimerase